MTPDEAAFEHCRDDPPWSWCGDRGGADHGFVFAWPAARGAVALTFDRRGRQHAMTLFAPARPGAQIAVFGRRFDVIWASADGASL